MDSIKTHCYATFDGKEAAERAMAALQGLQWPPQSSKRLEAMIGDISAAEVTFSLFLFLAVNSVVFFCQPQGAMRKAIRARHVPSAVKLCVLEKNSMELVSWRTHACAGLRMTTENLLNFLPCAEECYCARCGAAR